MSQTFLSLLETLANERPDLFFFTRYSEDPRYEIAESCCWTFQDKGCTLTFGVYDWQENYRDWLIRALGVTPIKLVFLEDGLSWDESILQSIVTWYSEDERMLEQ